MSSSPEQVAEQLDSQVKFGRDPDECEQLIEAAATIRSLAKERDALRFAASNSLTEIGELCDIITSLKKRWEPPFVQMTSWSIGNLQAALNTHEPTP